MSYLYKITNKYNFLTKLSYIKKLPNGKYRVLSQKGKNLGTYNSKEEAKKRLKQVEFFKFINKYKKASVNLLDIEDFSYSAIMRQLRQRGTEEQISFFMKEYKKNFDNFILNKKEDFDNLALKKTLNSFKEKWDTKINKNLIKEASDPNWVGDPTIVGKYIADIVKFLLKKIPESKKTKAINSLKYKIYYLNQNELANKKMPVFSAIGQSITFIKHILFNQDPIYIRNILNNIVKNL